VTAFLFSLSIFTRRIVQFNNEATDFRETLSQADGNRHLIGNIGIADSSAGFFMPYIYFPAYYQAEKGGFFEFSFANFGQQVALPSAQKPPGLYKYPENFEAHVKESRYDYYLLRSANDEEQRLKPILGPFYRLKTRTHQWWLFERIKPS
jgi:hypothetical protein